jgi:hypothetical protein
MTLNLTAKEAELLRVHFARHVAHVESELVHTDKFELQHALAAELAALRALSEKIDQQTAAQPDASAR